MLKSVKIKGMSGVRMYSTTLPLYRIQYNVLVGENVQDCARAVEEMFPGLSVVQDISPDTGGYAASIQHPEEGYNFFMLLSPNVNSEIPGICAHESLHLSWFICNVLGIKVSWKNHEAQAYIMQEIFNTSMAAFNDYTNRQNKKS